MSVKNYISGNRTTIEDIKSFILNDTEVYADLSFDERLVMRSSVYPDEQICWSVAVWNSGNTSVDVMGYTTEEEQRIRTLDDLVMYAYTNQDRIIIY